MSGIPVLNEGVTIGPADGGNIEIHVKLKRGRGFLSRFQPPVTERTVRLDELGSFVFNQIDGNKSALQIIEHFTDRYRTNRREAELSTVEFLKSLVKRGVVSILIK